MSSNLVYTIWAVFGGFILHFLLSSYLTVLLKPSFEDPVETAEDLIKRDIIPFSHPGSNRYIEWFADYPDPYYKQIAPRLHITKDWGEYDEMMAKVVPTGKFATIGHRPDPYTVPERDYKDWYRSKEMIKGTLSFTGHLTNKKWPLKKVSP